MQDNFNNIPNIGDSTQVESLLDQLTAEPTTSLMDTTTYDNDLPANMTDEELVAAHNERVTMSAEYKANVVLYQYIAQAQQAGRFISGHDKRMLYRQFLRNAKKGKYDYMFDPEKIAKRQERMKAKFDAINAPIKHTVDEIPTEVQDRLKEMVNEEAWNDLKPENY
jgi:hypothetical protein